MTTKGNVICGVIAGAALGAGLGMSMKTSRSKKKSLKNVTGKTLRAVGSFVEHMSF